MKILYKKIRHSIPRWYSKVLEEGAKKYILGKRELWKDLDNYLKQSPSTGASFGDYKVLYDEIRKRKPKEVLECGTGVTTIIIAHALKKNEQETGVRGRVTSMEDIEKYYDAAKQLIPKHLEIYVDLVLSPSVEDTHYFFRGIRYEEVPNRQYEFVFVDGPDTIPTKDNMLTCNFDYIHVVKNSSVPVFGMIDTRTSTCYVYSQIFGKKKFMYDYVRKIGFVGPCTKSDVGDALAIVHSLMKRHGFRRPSISSYF